MSHRSVTGYDAAGQRVVGVSAPTDVADAVPQGYIAYDLGNLGQSGKPDAGVAWLDFVAVRKFTLAAAFAGSQAVALTAANAACSFSVTKNGTQVGTVNFAAGATVATFTASSAVNVGVGDRLRVVTPTTQDSALADVTMTLAALRAL